MATVRRLPDIHIEPDGLGASLSRLISLELELGLAEARTLFIRLALTAAVVVTAAFAPLFGAAWQHLVIAGGGVALLAVILIAWGVTRVRHLGWPHGTVDSIEETCRWLAAQLKSRLT